MKSGLLTFSLTSSTEQISDNEIHHEILLFFQEKFYSMKWKPCDSCFGCLKLIEILFSLLLMKLNLAI